MLQIKDFPIKNSVADTDFLLIQDSVDFAYKSITKANLIASLGSSESNSQQIDPILAIAGLAADWSAENVTVVNNLVSELKDNSPNNKHATQNSTSNQATLINNCLNNKPVINFSGNQFYTHTNLTEPKTIIAVLRNVGTSDRTILGALSNNVNPLDAYYFKSNDSSSKMVIEISGTTPPVKSNAIINSNGFYIQSARISNSHIELFVNNILVARSTYTGTKFSINGNGVIGAAYYNNAIVDFFLGDIYRICMFSQILSYEDLFKAINYLKKYLNI